MFCDLAMVAAIFLAAVILGWKFRLEVLFSLLKFSDKLPNETSRHLEHAFQLEGLKLELARGEVVSEKIQNYK